MPVLSILAAGGAYFAGVFALAFILGLARVLWLGPAIGPLRAVLIETPIVLIWAWVLCGPVATRFGIGPHPGPRLAMGATAFAILMLAELALAALLAGETPKAWAAGLARPERAVGLAGQVAFALVPALRGSMKR